MSRRRGAWLAVLLSVSGHQLALAAGMVATSETGLRAADHGPVWGLAVALVAAAAVLAVGLAAWRILALRLRLRLAPTVSLPSGATLLRTWTAVTAVALALFLLQENVEHLAQHGHLPMLEPLLSGQYVLVLPVFASLGLLLVAAGLAVGTTLRHLERAAAVLVLRGRPPRRIGSWRSLVHDRRRRTRMVTALSPRRGPPQPVIG